MCLYKSKVSEMSFAPWGEDRAILLCCMSKAVAPSAGQPRVLCAALISWRILWKSQPV